MRAMGARHGDHVVAQIRMPRALRTRARMLALQRETSLRQLVREALERLLAAEEQAEPGVAEGRRCGRRSATS